MADAVRIPTITYERDSALVVWTGLDLDDSGSPVNLPGFPDRTVTIEGTFSVGGSCTLQGSNDNATWHSLTDPQGNVITKTAAGIELVTENPKYVRPLVTAGDGSTLIQVRLHCIRK
jgi:hypothetical protein